MELSRKQKMLLHTAATAAGFTDDEQRRVVQYNVGGAWSARDRTWTRQGFVAVMAFYEQRCGGRLDGFTAGYWGGEDLAANDTASMLHRVGELAAELSLAPDKLDEFIAGDHFTRGQYQHVGDLPAVWLRKLIEALKAISRRRNGTAKQS